MTREQMKSHFIVHTNGQDEWIKVDKRTYDKAIDMFCDAHEAEIEELRSTINRFVEEAAMYSNALDRNKEAYKAELKAKNDKLEVAKKIAQDAYTLGASRAAEMERSSLCYGGCSRF